MDNNYNQQRRIDDISPDRWMSAFGVLADHLTHKLRGRTGHGSFSKSALGCTAVEYLSKRAYDILCNGECRWPPEVSLETQLIRNAHREMRRIEDEWRRNEPPSPMQAERQLVMDLRTQASAKEMAYRIATARVAGNPMLLAYLEMMRISDDRRTIAQRMKISLREVEQLENELLRRLKA